MLVRHGRGPLLMLEAASCCWSGSVTPATVQLAGASSLGRHMQHLSSNTGAPLQRCHTLSSHTVAPLPHRRQKRGDSVQVLASRETPPMGSAVVSIGYVRAGEGAFNVIPDDAVFLGRMRSLSHDHTMHLKRRFAEVGRGLVALRLQDAGRLPTLEACQMVNLTAAYVPFLVSNAALPA